MSAIYHNLVSLVLVVLSTSCLDGPRFFDKDHSVFDTAMSSQVFNGVTTATFDPNSKSSQVMDAGALGSVVFPAGAFSYPITVATSQGADFASPAMAMALGLDTDIEPAGSAMFVRPAEGEGVVANSPFSIGIPFGATLALNNSTTHYAVAYKFLDPVRGIITGIIPTNEIVITGAKAVFSTLYFGSYQVVTTSVAILSRPPPVPSAPVIEQSQIANFSFALQILGAKYMQKSTDPTRGHFDIDLSLTGATPT
jgi:hypothetical protein